MSSTIKKHPFGCFALSFRGFDPEYAEEWFYLKSIKKYALPNSIGVSHKDILSLLPFDARIDKSLLPSGEKTYQLFADRLSTRYALSRHRERTPEIYYVLLTKDGERFILPYGEAEALERSETGIAELIRRKGCVTVRPSENSFCARETLYRFDGESFYIAGRKVTEAELLQDLAELPEDTVVCRHIESKFDFSLRIATLNCGTPELLYAVLTGSDGSPEHNWYTDNRELAVVNADGSYNGGKIDNFNDIVAEILKISSEFTDLEYMSYLLRLTDNGFYIMQVDTGKDLAGLKSFNAKTAAFIKRKLAHRRSFVTAKQAAILCYRKMWELLARRHGFVDFMYRNWRRALREDNKDKLTTAAEKRWAHERGFLSFRIKQYNLTDENYRECLSDYDYKWLRPLNSRYFKWVWDKVSLRYMFDDFSAYLPKYYYNLVRRDGKVTLLTMQDTPEGYAATFEDVLRLLREKGILALKQTEGSHGVGFYKLEYRDGAYLVNEQERSEEQMLAFLRSLKRYYNISEYIVMHDELRRIYSNVACTVRVMVINRTGFDPVIENVYFRIGTKKTGFTDNIGSGGIFAYADEVTGRFHDAEVIKKHIITPCPMHPDTGVKIEGVFPHWQEVRRVITDMCRYASCLEYLGFDVVITPDGFKILEINTHQDLHRYPTYNNDVHAYFERKVQLKKAGCKLA